MGRGWEGKILVPVVSCAGAWRLCNGSRKTERYPAASTTGVASAPQSLQELLHWACVLDAACVTVCGAPDPPCSVAARRCGRCAASSPGPFGARRVFYGCRLSNFNFSILQLSKFCRFVRFCVFRHCFVK